MSLPGYALKEQNCLKMCSRVLFVRFIESVTSHSGLTRPTRALEQAGG